jgi:hypothetical protein
MSRAHAISSLLAATALIAGEIRADEPPISARVPIVVVDWERPVERAEIDAVEQGLDAPSLRGRGLARELRALDGGFDQVDPASVGERFAAIQDEFFAGDHASARAGFESIAGDIEGDPCALVLAPELGPIAFGARLYLAVIARGDGEEAAVDGLLTGAAQRYPELTPEAAEFPPWLCEAHARAAAGTATGPGAPPTCEIEIGDGSAVARVDEADLRLAIEPGVEAQELAARVAALARTGGWPRAVAVVGRADGLEVLLIDAGSGGVARTGPPFWAPPTEMLPGETADQGSTEPPRRAWYENGLAWAVTGIGLAVAGTGFALGRKYGTPSREEPIAWAMMAAGAGIATTGVVLFFLPAPADGENEAVAFGVGGAGRF